MSGNNGNTAGRVEKVNGGQAQDFGRVFGFGVLGILILASLAFVSTTIAGQNTDKIYKKDGTIYEGEIKSITNEKVFIDPVGFVPSIDVRISDIERIEYADGRIKRFDEHGRSILGEFDTDQTQKKQQSFVVVKRYPDRGFALVSGLAALYAYDKFKAASDLNNAADEIDRLHGDPSELRSEANRNTVVGCISVGIAIGAFINSFRSEARVMSSSFSLKLDTTEILTLAYVYHFR